MTKINASDSFVRGIQSLRQETMYRAMLGDYKGYVTAMKEHAKLAVTNKELLSTITSPKVSVPLFSKTGLKILKVMIMNFFRIKTPEEKELKRFAEELSVKRKLEQMM